MRERLFVFNILLFVIIGILSRVYLGSDFLQVIYLIKGIGFAGVLFRFFFKKIPFNFRWLDGVFVFLLVSGIGFVLTDISLDRKVLDGDAFIGQIISDIEEKPGSFKMSINLVEARNDSVWRKVDQEILLYTSKEANDLEVGEMILFSGTLQQIKKPSNPFQFNYFRYLRFQGIDYQGYAKRVQQFPTLDAPFSVKVYFRQLRQKLIDKLVRYDFTEKQKGILSALVLGFKSDLDPEVRTTYSKVGVMHVLAVSGLHVGIIYLVFNYLLKAFNRRKYLKWVKLALLLGILWGYALITGMSPSVMRAATMFSFFVLSEHFTDKVSVYQNLSASCLFLLLINPLLLMHVGFQLSYAAVLAIVSIQPLLYKKIKVNNWLFDKAWALCTVSIAAQLGTFPLAVYYFHIFPIYFLLSNLIIIPTVTILLYGGFLVLLLDSFSFLEWLASWVAKSIYYLMSGVNYLMDLIASWPQEYFTNISLLPLQVMLLYLMIIFGYFALVKEKIKALYIALGVSIVVLGLQLYKNYHFEKQKVFICYDHRSLGMDVFNGRSAVSIRDDERISFVSDGAQNGYGILKKYVVGLRKDTTDMHMGFWKEGPFMAFNGQKILLVGRKEMKTFGDKKIDVDVLILNTKIYAKQWNKLLQQYTPETVVISNAIRPWEVEKMQKFLQDVNGVVIWSLNEQGAFIIEK